MSNYKDCIKNPIISQNMIDNVLSNRFSNFMNGICFTGVNIPTLDVSKNFIFNDQDSTKEQYKAICANGDVYSLCNDSLAALINLAKCKIQNDTKMYTSKEIFKFKSDEINNRIENCAIIYQPTFGEEIVDFAADIYKFLLQNLNSTVKMEISNTKILSSILSNFTKTNVTREKLQSVINGNIENEADSQASQVFDSIKDIKGGSETINYIAEKINIKESIDALINVFDVTAALEIFGLKEAISVNPFYLGENIYDDGLVIKFISSEKVVANIGSLVLNDGTKVVYAKLDNDNCTELLVNKEQIIACVMVVMKTREAMSKAYKLREIYNKSGCVVKTLYDDGTTDLTSVVYRYEKSDILFVNKKGEVEYISKNE